MHQQRGRTACGVGCCDADRWQPGDLGPALARLVVALLVPAGQTLAIVWYATAGHHPADVAEHRTRAPWYATKTEPSTADMTAKLRRVLIAAKFRLPRP